MRCDGECVLVSESREHCGACDNACEAGEVCSAGTCATSCGGGLTECEGICEDLETDRANCGECGNACASGQVCVDGACELSCAEGQEICDGACTDTQSSFENCGSCGNACDDGQVCSLGACALSCASGLTDCSGSCVELPYNVNHCTACDAACGPYANAIPSCNNQCIMTCNEGFEDCNDDRVDGCEAELAVDEMHCGECGNVCSFANAATECVDGACVMGECNAGFDDCDADPANGCECRIAVVGPPGTSPFSGGTLRDLDEDPATGAITPSGMVTDTSRDFLWVVNVNESTVSRWDASTRSEIARYRVGLPAGECAGACCHNSGCNMPSRVVVDGNGDAYVANRAFDMQGTVVKIAGDVAECIDRNGNGMIDTSSSATPMGWGEDECILWTANVGPVNAVLRSITSGYLRGVHGSEPHLLVLGLHGLGASRVDPAGLVRAGLRSRVREPGARSALGGRHLPGRHHQHDLDAHGGHGGEPRQRDRRRHRHAASLGEPVRDRHRVRRRRGHASTTAPRARRVACGARRCGAHPQRHPHELDLSVSTSVRSSVSSSVSFRAAKRARATYTSP